MNTTDDRAPRTGPHFASTHPLLRIAAAAVAATTITWLGGMLFGPVSDARARQLAQGMSSAPQRGPGARTAQASTSGRTPVVPTPSVPAA